MTAEMWITLSILVVALILFISEMIRLDVVAIGVMTALILTNILTIDEGLAGFSNKVVISIGALFILGGAVFQTGLAGGIAGQILKFANGSPTRLLVILMISVALMSAFISSTGVVALMLPAVISLARQMQVSTSRLLIPMAYSALIGGSMTLIGTPPNLLVSDALLQSGYAPFDFFSFTPVGLLLLAIGVIYMAVAGRRWLPDRIPAGQIQTVITPGELFALYELPGSLFRLRVQDDSPLVGQQIGEVGLRSHYGLNILSITHLSQMPTSRLPGLARNGVAERYHVPPAETRIAGSDVLLVQGSPDAVSEATGALKLAVLAAEPIAEGDVITNEVGIAEVLIRPRSSLIGKTVAEVHFGSTYHLTVLDIKRPGVDVPLLVKATPLKLGDTLLVQGEWKHIFALKRLRQDFIVLGEREAIQLGAFTRPAKAPLTLLIMIGMILLVAFNVFDLSAASLAAALLLILTGCLTMDEAYESIDLKSLFLMAGMLPMGTALEKVGLVDVLASGMIATVGQSGPLLIMVALFVLTVCLTQVLSNTATTVLLAPLALAAAQGLGVQPHIFLMAVAVAASAAFATPLASPVNTLVVSAGNYRFTDYARVGVPLIVLCLVVVLLVLPLLWSW